MPFYNGYAPFGPPPMTTHTTGSILSPSLHAAGLPQMPSPYGQPTLPPPLPMQPSYPLPPTAGPPAGSFYAAHGQHARQQPTDLASVFQAMSVQAPPDSNYYMDTGASQHMSYNPGNMQSLTPCNSKSIMFGNGDVAPVSHIGHTTLPHSNNRFFLNNVLVSDKMVKNLVSVRKFSRDNWVTVAFDPFGYSIKDLDTDCLLQRCDSDDDLYPVLPASAPAKALATVSLPTWHRRLGHPGSSVLQFLHSRKFISSTSNKLPICHACQTGKHCRLPFVESVTKTTRLFELVHSDLWTSPVVSLGGFKYYILLLDDFSHFLWVIPLRAKSDVYSVLCNFHMYVKNQFKTVIQTFQCDNGREFNNHLLLTFFKSNGITTRFSCPYTSQQNGKAERAIRTVNNILRTFLFQASLPPSFWTEALLAAIHTVNLLPTRTLSFKTPFEILFGFFPRYDHLRVFGCLCYPNTSATSTHKLSPRSSACVYLGPATDHKGHRCLDLITQRVIISRHVVFDEDHFPYSDFHATPSPTDYDHFIPDDDHLPPLQTTQPVPTPHPSTDSPSTSASTAPPPLPPLAAASQPPSPPAPTSSHPMTTRSRTGSLKPRVPFNLTTMSSVVDVSPLPRSTA